MLLADEPTTGLDASSAADTVQVMRDMMSSATILCTIHQPNTDTFNMFDDLLLLAEGGQVAYCGPIHGGQLLDFFEKRNGVPFPPTFNVADVIVQAVAVVPSNQEESR